MPDRRRHRGPHPQDGELFAPAAHARLLAASEDLAWLLGRGYVLPSALKLVGDRHGLRERQRLAVLRASASDGSCADRKRREVGPEAAAGRPIWIDGYNVLITVEAALGGGVLLVGRDGCLRDLASLHGSFKRVEETEPALRRIGTWLAAHEVGPCRLLFDQPVSNSGRLAALAREIAAERAWPWEVDVVPDPDGILAAATPLVATSDSVVLDAPVAWLGLARHVVEASDVSAPVVDFRPRGPVEAGA